MAYDVPIKIKSEDGDAGCESEDYNSKPRVFFKVNDEKSTSLGIK